MRLVTKSEISFDEQLRNLLRGCAAADGTALKRLYELVSPTLFASLRRILRRRPLAEEALQEVFVTIWQRAAQFRPERGQPMAWMISIARYRAIDLLRRERFGPLLVPELPEEVSVGTESPEHAELGSPGAALLERCLALLSDKQRQCLELAYVDGNSHEAISQLLGSPLGTVKSWIRRGLRTLRTCLES